MTHEDNESPFDWTINLDDLRGKPKEVWKHVKADELSPIQLENAFDVAFDSVEFNEDDPLHCQMLAGVEASKRRIEAIEEDWRSRCQAQYRKMAAQWVEKEHGVDPKTLPDEMLDTIFASMCAYDEAREAQETDQVVEIPEIVSSDEEELILVDSSGAILAFVDAPRDDLERRLILEWVGTRLTTAQARQTGIKAEKDFWLKKINQQFDPKINKQGRIIERLEYLYAPVGQAYLDELRANIERANAEAVVAGKKAQALPKSVKIGMLTLQYHADSAKVEIVDETGAIKFLRNLFAEKPELFGENPEEVFAAVVREKVELMRGSLPAKVKDLCTEEHKAEYGLYYYPGGKEVFSLK